MIKVQNPKQYDLEERTLRFAQSIKNFVKTVPRTLSNIEYMKQLIRSSGSVGANYIEANEALSKKDFILRLKISRKEARESRYWLKLLDVNDELNSEKNRQDLINESIELMKIFGSIVSK